VAGCTWTCSGVSPELKRRWNKTDFPSRANGNLAMAGPMIRRGSFRAPHLTSTPRMGQPGTASPNNLVLRKVLPSSPPIYQTLGKLVASCCQMRSGCLSPFKSPTATITTCPSAIFPGLDRVNRTFLLCANRTLSLWRDTCQCRASTPQTKLIELARP